MTLNNTDPELSLCRVGWREQVDLPELGITALRAKVDTGAKTCALHTYFVEPYQHNGEDWVRFGIHPNQDNTEETIECQAPLADQRNVMDSGGHTEMRYVIRTRVTLASLDTEIEITLTDRESMRYRMLLGRNFLNNRCLVDPAKSYLCGSSKTTPNNEAPVNHRSPVDENCHTVEE